GYDEQVVADGLGDEFIAGAPRSFRINIKGPARHNKLVTILEPGDHAIALALVILDDGRDIVVPGRHARVLHDARGADISELLKLDHLSDEAAGAVTEAEAPAGHAVGLAEAVENQRVLVPRGRTGERRIVAEGPIDLVAHEQNAVFTSQEGQLPQRFSVKD